MEQPFPWNGSVCMFELASFKLLRQAHSSVVFDQCLHGQVATTPTEILYHLAEIGRLDTILQETVPELRRLTSAHRARCQVIQRRFQCGNSPPTPTFR